MLKGEAPNTNFIVFCLTRLGNRTSDLLHFRWNVSWLKCHPRWCKKTPGLIQKKQNHCARMRLLVKIYFNKSRRHKFLKIWVTPHYCKNINMKILVSPNWKWWVQDSSRRVARISDYWSWIKKKNPNLILS